MKDDHLMSAVVQVPQCRERQLPIEQQVGQQNHETAARQQSGQALESGVRGGAHAVGCVE